MAEEDEDDQLQEEAETGGEGSGSGKKKLIILIVIGLLVVGGTIGGTLFLLGFFDGDGGDEGSDENVEDSATEVVVPEKPKSAMYFPIKPAFVVNFHSRGRQRYLQAELTVMTRDMDVFNAMQTHMPLIKNRMVMLLGGEVYEELQTDEGKELLRQKALQALQDIMQQEIAKPGIEQVLFTSFVMQ